MNLSKMKTDGNVLWYWKTVLEKDHERIYAELASLNSEDFTRICKLLGFKQGTDREKIQKSFVYKLQSISNYQGKQRIIAKEPEMKEETKKEETKVQEAVNGTPTPTVTISCLLKLANKIEYVETESLTTHDRNREIYHDDEDPDFVSSIKKEGVLEPLVVSHGNVIIGGHRRYKAAFQMGIKAVPVRKLPKSATPEDLVELMVILNKSRERDNETRIREFAALKWAEEQRLANRKGGKPTIQKERSDEIAAKKVGLSPTTAKKGLKVVEKIDDLKKAGKPKEAKKVADKLKKSVDGAYKETTEPDKPKSEKSTKPGTKPLTVTVWQKIEMAKTELINELIDSYVKLLKRKYDTAEFELECDEHEKSFVEILNNVKKRIKS